MLTSDIVNYATPPIREAVCEFIFGGESKWDLTTPGRIFEELRARYPAEPVTAPSSRDVAEDRIELRSTGSGDEFIRYSESNLSVYSGPRYSGWPAFRERVVEALTTFVQQARPSRVTRIRIRYSNHTEFEGSIELLDYFTVVYRLPQGLPFGSIFDFTINVQGYSRPQNDRSLRIALKSEPAESLKVAVRLDLETYDRVEQDASVGSTMERVDEARAQISAAFEACITDALREKYGRV